MIKNKCEELIPKFERADWLIWFLWKIGIPPEYLAEITLICARYALQFSGKHKTICEKAIKATEEYLKNPTEKNKQAADEAADKAGSAATVAYSGYISYSGYVESMGYKASTVAYAGHTASATAYAAYMASIALYSGYTADAAASAESAATFAVASTAYALASAVDTGDVIAFAASVATFAVTSSEYAKYAASAEAYERYLTSVENHARNAAFKSRSTTHKILCDKIREFLKDKKWVPA